MYSIKLADGTELNNLKLNGNNFISENIISDDVFKDNLSAVIITNEDGVTEYTNMKLIQNKVHGNRSWFILAEKTKDELEKEHQESVISDLSYELVMKDLTIQQLESEQANLTYQLMMKGVL